MKLASYNLLIDAGFAIKSPAENFGTIAPEQFDVGKNHFTAQFRDVFVGNTFNGYTYVTSCLYGEYRGYRCKNKYNTNILNIFAHDILEVEAVREFIRKFKKLEYNVVR